MSNLKWDIAAALVAFIITTSGFLVMVENAPTQSVNISKDQAIGIIKASNKVDPEKTIVKDEYLTSAELQYLNINWGSYLWWWKSSQNLRINHAGLWGVQTILGTRLRAATEPRLKLRHIRCGCRDGGADACS